MAQVVGSAGVGEIVVAFEVAFVEVWTGEGD